MKQELETTWVWVKIKPPGDRRFWSMFPLTRVPFGGYPIFDPQPNKNWKQLRTEEAISNFAARFLLQLCALPWQLYLFGRSLEEIQRKQGLKLTAPRRKQSVCFLRIQAVFPPCFFLSLLVSAF